MDRLDRGRWSILEKTTKMQKNTKKRINILITTSVVFMCMEVIINILGYQSADHEVYEKFYIGLQNLNINELFGWQVLTTGSAEPIFGVSNYIAEKAGISYETYICIERLFFTYTISIILLRQTKIPIAITLMLTSYYFWGIYSGAYRLMLGLSILLTGIIIEESLKQKNESKKGSIIRNIFDLLAVLTHFQLLAIVLAKLIGNQLSKSNLIQLKINSKLLISGLVITIITIILIIQKANIINSGKYNVATNLAFKVINYILQITTRNLPEITVAILVIGTIFMISRKFGKKLQLSETINFSIIYSVTLIINRSRTFFVIFGLWQYTLLKQKNRTSRVCLVALSTYSAIKVVDGLNLIATTGQFFR